MNTMHMNATQMRAVLKRAAHQQIQRDLDLALLTYSIDALLAESVLEQFADEGTAIRWLWSPHADLGGECPLAVSAQRGGMERVLRLLARLAGVPEDAVRVAS